MEGGEGLFEGAPDGIEGEGHGLFFGSLILLLKGGFEWLRDSGLYGCVSLEV